MKQPQPPTKPDVVQSRKFRVLEKYDHILLADFLASHELLVVEMPWTKIAQSFPDTVFVKRYGM